MKTFTTCAEKKAKQFFNLLQGYTKGIRITAILILLLMGVSNASAVDLYLRGIRIWDAKDQTKMSQDGSTYSVITYLSTVTYKFKIADSDWNYNNNYEANNTNATVSLNTAYTTWHSNGKGDMSFTPSTAGFYKFSLNTSNSQLTISKYDPSPTEAPSDVVNETNVMFYIQGYSDNGYNVLRANSSNSISSNSHGLSKIDYSISYVNTKKTNLSTNYYISNNPSSWNGKSYTDIKNAQGGELFEAQDSNNKTNAKTAKTTTSVANTTLNISTTTDSKTGVCNGTLYIQYYINNDFTGVTYNSSTASYASISANGATACQSTLDISDYANGTYTLKTILTDGIIYYIADTDEFTVNNAKSHVVTISYLYNSTSIKTSTTESVSESTVKEITAPAIDGYEFSSWTLGTGVQSTNTSTNPISITTKESGVYTLTANYVEDLTSTWYIAGTAGSDSPFTGWGTSGTNMYKKTGHSTEKKYYCTFEVTTTASSDNQFEFQVYNSSNDSYYGYNNFWITQANNSTKVYTGNPTNMKFRPYVTGTYEFELDCTGDPKLTVTWPSYNQIRFYSAQTGGNETNTYDWENTNTNTWKKTISLTKGTHYFKVLEDSEFLGNNGTMNRNSCTSWSMEKDKNNCGINADVAGDYLFTYDKSTNKLTVTYPEAYKVTYGVGTNKGTDKVTTTPSITSESLVLASTEITFSKGETKEGYTWKNWNSKADGTGTNLGTGVTYFSSDRTADISVYACYDLVTYNITYNLNGGSGTMTPTSYTITTTTFNLPTPSKTGYTFAGWFDNEELTGDAVTQITKGTTGDKTFYAKWTAIEYTITYNDLYGVTHSNPETYTIESETITFTAPTSTRTGYDFAGWNPTEITKGSTGNKNVTAQWTEILSTITITTNPAEGGYVTVDDESFTPGNTVQVGVTTTCTVTTTANEGYGVAAWEFKGAAEWKGGQNTVTLASDGSGEVGELIANYIPLSRNINFDKQSGEGGTDAATVTYTQNDYSPTSVVAPTRSGYTFGGYYSEANDAGVQIVSAEGAWLSNASGYTDANGNWLKSAENTTLYAHWTANTYTVTLQHSTIAGYGSGGTSSVTATYDAAMPEVVMPTAADGYVFMGYFDGEQGAGIQYYNADGTSAHVWDKAEDATLYAHFVKAEITQITLDKYTFEPVEAGGTGFVIATPTIEPTPTGTITLCWRLLYNSGNPVAGRDAQVVSGNSVQFSIAGLAAGTYKIEAVLRAGNNCGSGDVLSTKTVNFTIASNYTITVKYTCDGKEIMAASKVPARVSEETEITAPDITGYTFSSWEAGDGVTIKSTNGNSVKITAIYDGYLTAKYTARPMVYFKNTLGWEKVYVYTFSDNAWWNDGTGVHPATNKLEQGEMTQIGESDVYYFELDKPDSDYTQDNNANPNYIAFSNKDMRTENGAFWECDAIYRGDHKAELTLFVPQKDQTPETHNKTKYYSKGIWMKYNSTESGYQLPGTIPNDDPDHDGWGTYGNKFTAQTPGGYTFSITKYLEANTEYTFKIKNYVWVKDYNNTDNNQWFGYDGTINSTTSSIHFKGDNDEGKNNGNAKIKTTAEGEYTFTIDLSQGKVLLSVEYPIEVGDYRVIYKDNATWSHASAHDANWYHPSRIIKKNKTAEPTKDIISFFISYGQSTTMQFQRVKSITNGNVTWENAGEARIPDAVNKAGVYNFIVTQTANGASISMENSAEPYTGNYYIRVDALAGKWDNYKTNPENRMTYSAFSESEANSFGDKYSHYATKYCDEGTNIKFVIANDYSPCISDTLAQDVKVNGANPFDNLDEHGTIISDYQQNKANVRFMWNHKTNKISRVYIGSAAEAQRHFLVLKSNNEMKGEDGQNLHNEGDDHAKRKAVFKDTQNWMYERTIKVQPGTRVKLYACYPMDNNSGVDAAEQKAQYFRGAYDGDIWNEKNSIVILGGSGTDWNTIRVIYDFKTNRLMAALVPDQEVSGEKTIAADVMIIRKHQDAATSITLTNDNSKLKDVKTVYGSLQLNRWVLNNRKSDKFGIEYCTEKINGQDTYSENKTNEHHPVLSPGEQKSIYERALYFISFPFDVHLSDVFGFGTYGTHWVISDYNGLRRAQRGYFAEDCINEDCTNWDYIWDPSNFTLKANQGYLLSLDLDLMRYDNTDFWLHNIDQVELFFPSTANLATIEKTSYTMPALSEEYLCKINHNTDGTTPDRDRRVKDSYWRCIGVPSFADYDGSLYKSKEDAESDKDPINWNTDYTWTADESGFPFLYEWNVTDNSLSVQNTSAYQFKPTFAYLVQNGDAIYWKAVNAKPSSPIIARQRTETERNYEWKIALLNNGNQEDQTFLRITDNENVTTAFDFNQDLAKEFNYGRSDIYTLIGYERAAANSMPCSDETTIIPLGLNIEQAGDYTITMPEGVENIGITLVDNETGIHTNLSAGQEYTLTLNNGICENRLFIEVSPIQNTPTDLEYTTGDTREQTTRKMLIDGMLYLIRDGIIYDAQGHKL